VEFLERRFGVKLVSFKLCPFVQQVAMVLMYKGVEFDVEYIELSSPPDWFLQVSPLKKVPILMVDDGVLFDSIAINEYLEEKYPHKLFSIDLFEKANQRAWVQFINSLTWSVFHLSVKETKAQYDDVLTDLHKKLDELENGIVGETYFSGNTLSLVDVALAPLLLRLQYIEDIHAGIFQPERHKKIMGLRNYLLSQSLVTDSVVDNFSELYYSLLGKRKGYISQFIDAKYQVNELAKQIY